MLCDKLMSLSYLESWSEAENHLASSGHWKHSLKLFGIHIKNSMSQTQQELIT